MIKIKICRHGNKCPTLDKSSTISDTQTSQLTSRENCSTPTTLIRSLLMYAYLSFKSIIIIPDQFKIHWQESKRLRHHGRIERRAWIETYLLPCKRIKSTGMFLSSLHCKTSKYSPMLLEIHIRDRPWLKPKWELRNPFSSQKELPVGIHLFLLGVTTEDELCIIHRFMWFNNKYKYNWWFKNKYYKQLAAY